MIYTVTLNPAIDYQMHTEEIILGQTNRSQKEELSFGGKGINVSLILNELGIKSCALGFTGGFTGIALENFLNEKGISSDFVNLKEGLTRINIKIKGQKETEINSKGPEISKEELASFFEKLSEIEDGSFLVLSGSIPEGIDKNIYEVIIIHLKDKNIRFVVDTTGPALLNTLKHSPFLIKPNKAELEELMGRSLNSEDDYIDSAFYLQSLGAENVLVSLGEEGAYLICQNGQVLKSEALCKEVKNTVGAGDSMVGAFLAGLNFSYTYAFKLANAAGAATAASQGLGTKEEIYKFMQEQ